jgi:two-component system, NtrC family, response regulator AtoC
LNSPEHEDEMTQRVLIVEDDLELLASLEDALGDAGYAVATARSGEDALLALADRDFDVVLADVKMPGLGGIELCTRIAGNHPGVPVLLMTAFDDLSLALDALRAGARDFVTKPFTVEQLCDRIETALSARSRADAVARLSRPELEAPEITELVGSSPSMRSVAEQIGRASKLDVTVLITGESGTGKEIVARALHDHGSRRDGPFVAMSCAAVPADILESELFGHAQGAFTGAHATHEGLFAYAEGGTLFLDEIGAMPMALQAKLLRAVEARAVRPVGDSRELSFDARIIAATNEDLDAAVREGRFREDLLFRLKVFHIHLPPLRQRGDDVIELTQYFVRQFADARSTPVPQVAPEVTARLLDYDWPGNVRELENCMQACVALAEQGWIGVDELPTGVRRHPAVQRPSDVKNTSLEDLERRHIGAVLEAAHGNKSEAARILGINRATLYRKLKVLKISAP